MNVTPFIPELTLSAKNAQTFLDGEIEFTVSIDPPPATVVTILIEAVDSNGVAQTVTPTGGVVINPAAGETSSSATAEYQSRELVPRDRLQLNLLILSRVTFLFRVENRSRFR